MTTTAADLVTFLHKRGPMLARLAAAPTDQATLTETVSVSRTTVDRALDSFEEWGLIAADADRLEPTLFARLVLTVYDDFEADVMAAAPHEAGGAPLWRTTAERSDALGLVADHLDLLEYAQSPREKRALVTELPAARSTVNWAVRELEGAGLMQRTAAGYTTTPLGQRLTPRYRTLLATLTDLLAARDLLAHLPADCAFAPSLFTGTVIERADTATPYRLLEGLRERLATADQVRILLPALSNPQLLDMCHHQVVRHGATLELITDPALAETLTSEFPGPLVEMAAAATGTFTASVAETPSFGLVLVETDAGPSVSLLVYSDNQTMEGAFHAATDAALAWAEDYYEHVQSHATETTTDWVDAAEPTGDVALAAVADPGRVEREAEGFVQLTAEYFANRTAAPPATAWRTGFDLVDVHAGYAIDRQPAGDSEPTHQTLTDDLLTRLSDGTDHALLGAPGSGKSTVCKSVACRWYEQGRGAVFYRASGTGTTFGSPPLFSAQLRATEGQTLVVVEDAVRAEANAIFRVMEEFREDTTVTFLVDARTGEWDAPPAFPPDARLDAYRTETVETVPMPTFDESEAERLIQHFQDTVNDEGDVTASHLLRGISTETDQPDRGQGQPGELLLVLHRLTLHADPLTGDDTSIPTTLAADIQRTAEALRSAGDMALDVGVLVNLLNATGIGVQPAFVYALAADRSDENCGREAFDAVHDALSSLDGRLVFERKEGTESTEAPYRAVHEVWSSLFLEQLLAAGEHEASRRFGRCVTALLAVADDPARRARIAAAVGGDTLAVDRIESAPREWADTITERLFHFGLTHPGLAPLFGATESATIALPAACSPEMKPCCAAWRGRMYVNARTFDRAQCELERAIDLVESTEGEMSEQTIAVKARSYKDLGAVGWQHGDHDFAKECLVAALESYRSIDDRLGETDCYTNLSLIASERGNLDRATRWLERALDSYREIGGGQVRQAKTLNKLGWTAVLRGDLDCAEAYLEQSAAIGSNLDGYFGVAYAFVNLGEVARLRGDLDCAETYYKHGIDIAKEAGYPPGTAYGLLGVGKTALARADLARAEAYVQRSLDIFREAEDRKGRVRGCRYHGIIARKRGDIDAAKDHLRDALTHCREVGYDYHEGKTLIELGELARGQDNPERARDQFADAVEIYRDMGAIRDAIESLERLAKICETLDDEAAALTHYEAAAAIVEETEFIEPREALTERCATLTDTARDTDGN